MTMADEQKTDTVQETAPVDKAVEDVKVEKKKQKKVYIIEGN